MANRIDLLNKLLNTSLKDLWTAIGRLDDVIYNLDELGGVSGMEDYNKETSELFKIRTKLLKLYNKIIDK